MRESLARRGYEYVKRHGWDQKKMEYLELIDSLSTEIFADNQAGDVQAGDGNRGSISGDVPQDSHIPPMADTLLQEVDTVAVRLEERSSMSSLESRVRTADPRRRSVTNSR
jgi:hypothetical protein